MENNQTDQNKENQLLFALMTPAGEFTRILQRDELDKLIKEYKLDGWVCGIAYKKLFEVNTKVEVPWDDGLQQFASGQKQSGDSEVQQENESSTMRDSSEGGTRATRGRKKRSS